MTPFIISDAAVNTSAALKTPIKRTISTGDAAKTQILQVTANPNSTAPDTKRIKLEASNAQGAANLDDPNTQ